MAKTITLQVSRYSPEHDFEPYFQSYEVPVKEEWVILDALNYIKDQLDGTLTFRWSCRMGICGSCGYTVNNEPKLGCATFLTQYLPGPVKIEPLRNFPVVRDLVVEISEFLEKLKKVKPWLIHEDGNGGTEYLQTPAQLEEFRQHSMCINCLLCYSACPISGLDPIFVGPAALALAHRYNKDSRDQGAAERMAILSHPEGIWGCTFVGECTKVCPKHVDPAGAIQQYKILGAIESMKQFLMPWANKSNRQERP
jgi:fumarate reductase iron-sulfur subunit